MLYQVYSPIEAQRVIMRLGDSFSALRKNPKSKTYRIYTQDSDIGVVDLEEIISINTYTYPENEYVYDLETGCHFHTGVGVCLVHNTDSVMISCPEEWSKEQTFEYSMELADEITAKLFTSPCKLEFEKVFSPYFLKGKKMYAGLMAEALADIPKMQIKGLFLVRRETSEMVRDFGFRVLDLMLRENNSFQVLRELETYIEDILEGNVPLEKFMKNMSIQADDRYKGDLPAIRVLASKVNERLGYMEYHPGDRVKYVQVVPPSIVQKMNTQATIQWGTQANATTHSKARGKAKQGDFFISTKGVPQMLKVEDPTYVKKHDLLVDYEYYLESLERKIMDLLQFESVRIAVQQLFNQKLQKFHTADFKPSSKKRSSVTLTTTRSQPLGKKMKTLFDFYPKMIQQPKNFDKQ